MLVCKWMVQQDTRVRGSEDLLMGITRVVRVGTVQEDTGTLDRTSRSRSVADHTASVRGDGLAWVGRMYVLHAITRVLIMIRRPS